MLSELQQPYAWAYASSDPELFVSTSFTNAEDAAKSMLDDVRQIVGEDWEDVTTVLREDDGSVYRVDVNADIMCGRSQIWMLIDLELGTSSV